MGENKKEESPNEKVERNISAKYQEKVEEDEINLLSLKQQEEQNHEVKRTKAEREYQEKFLNACQSKLKKEAITWTDIFNCSPLLPNQIAILDEILTKNPNFIKVIPNFMLDTCSPPGWGKAQENTLLHYAMLRGEKKFIDLFRKHRADLTAKNFFKQRPLDLYQEPDRVQYVRFVERDSILITIAQLQHPRLGQKSKWKYFPDDLWTIIYEMADFEISKFKQRNWNT